MGPNGIKEFFENLRPALKETRSPCIHYYGEINITDASKVSRSINTWFLPWLCTKQSNFKKTGNSVGHLEQFIGTQICWQSRCTKDPQRYLRLRLFLSIGDDPIFEPLPFFCSACKTPNIFRWRCSFKRFGPPDEEQQLLVHMYGWLQVLSSCCRLDMPVACVIMALPILPTSVWCANTD